jgi:hypothetical protein
MNIFVFFHVCNLAFAISATRMHHKLEETKKEREERKRHVNTFLSLPLSLSKHLPRPSYLGLKGIWRIISH